LAKAQFWERIKKNPLIDMNNLTTSKIAQLCGNLDIAKRVCDNDKYHAWFMDTDSAKNLASSGVEAAVEKLLEIVNTPMTEVGPGRRVTYKDQIAAAKEIMDRSGFGAAKKPEVVYQDKTVQEMSKDELEAFIKTNTPSEDKSTGKGV
jgi:hypothetical protein